MCPNHIINGFEFERFYENRNSVFVLLYFILNVLLHKINYIADGNKITRNKLFHCIEIFQILLIDLPKVVIK